MPTTVIPAKAGIQAIKLSSRSESIPKYSFVRYAELFKNWIPACTRKGYAVVVRG